MITLDFLNTAANVTLFLLFVRLIQTQFMHSNNNPIASALAFLFH